MPRRLIALAALLPLFAGCFWNQDSDDDPAAVLAGLVRDGAGNPLANVPVQVEYVVMGFEAPDTSLAGGGENVNILFSLPESRSIRLMVQAFDTGERLATLAEGIWDSGQHSVTWDWRDGEGRLLPMDLYRLVLESPADTSDAELLANPDFQTLPLPWRAVATTNELGRFEIRAEQLAHRHGHLFRFTDEHGVELGSHPFWPLVRLHVANEDGQHAHSAWVEFSEGSTREVVLTLPE